MLVDLDLIEIMKAGILLFSLWQIDKFCQIVTVNLALNGIVRKILTVQFIVFRHLKPRKSLIWTCRTNWILRSDRKSVETLKFPRCARFASLFVVDRVFQVFQLERVRSFVYKSQSFLQPRRPETLTEKFSRCRYETSVTQIAGIGARMFTIGEVSLLWLVSVIVINSR